MGGGCVEAGGNRDNQQVRLTARYDGHKLPRHTRSSIQASDLQTADISVCFRYSLDLLKRSSTYE